jgi:hypothetical protein
LRLNRCATGYQYANGVGAVAHTQALCNDSLPTDKRARFLLNSTITDVLAIESKFRGTHFASTDHRFKAVKLPPGNQPHRTATGAGQHGDEGIVAVTKRIRPFQKKDRTGFHLFGDPCFEKLQLSCHSSLRWVNSTGLRPKGKPKPWAETVVLNLVRLQPTVKRVLKIFSELFLQPVFRDPAVSSIPFP